LIYGRKEENLEYWELSYEYWIIIEFIKKLSSLVTVISFIVFRGTLGLENPFVGLVIEV